MTSRRNFIFAGAKIATAAGLAPVLPVFDATANYFQKNKLDSKSDKTMTRNKYRPSQNFGLGGVAIGNAFRPTTDEQAQEALEGAWEAGVRYFDTSPFYGFGLSEQRFGYFLHNKKREDYMLSSKVGRLFKPSKNVPKTMWKDPSPFSFEYDYSASGVRRSIEDSLNRMGIQSLDIVFIHDLSPDNDDMGENWTEYFEIARKGAMPELTRMREEGLIKGWGMGVNRIDPILRTLEVADADIFLSATRYSLIEHEDALNRLFPACEEKGVSIVSGAPLNSGFLAGIDRYNYSEDIPQEFMEKRERLNQIAQNHGTDLRTAALQFCAAPAVVSAVIPGTRYGSQAKENVESMKVEIPMAFWEELKHEQLIAENAPVPQ
jgi:D-threo-aldose 1-dehydrogenase